MPSNTQRSFDDSIKNLKQNVNSLQDVQILESFVTVYNHAQTNKNHLLELLISHENNGYQKPKECTSKK